MENWVQALWGAMIGGFGSFAYFVALLFGFIKAEEIFLNLWPTGKTINLLSKILRVILFILMGSLVAFVFQLPQVKLAPIQAFIVGTTWPTVVAQILTSRQSESPQSIKDQIQSLLGK